VAKSIHSPKGGWGLVDGITLNINKSLNSEKSFQINLYPPAALPFPAVNDGAGDE
jgi:hypothetical protein